MSSRNERTVQLQFSPASDSSGTETVYEVPEGSAFRSTELTVYTVSDPSADITLGLYNGSEQVAPVDEDLTVVQSDMTIKAGSTWDVGDTISLRWDTASGWTEQTVVVLLDGFDVSVGVE